MCQRVEITETKLQRYQRWARELRQARVELLLWAILAVLIWQMF